jgi:hypothetical protein
MTERIHSGGTAGSLRIRGDHPLRGHRQVQEDSAARPIRVSLTHPSKKSNNNPHS